jgi:hypothetical protein
MRKLTLAALAASPALAIVLTHVPALATGITWH